MTTVSCPKCGATLPVPSVEFSSVLCPYCRTEVSTSSVLPTELVAAHRLDASLSRRLDQHADRNRKLLLGVGVVLGSLIALVLAVVVSRSASSDASTPPRGLESSAAAPAASNPEPISEPSPEPAPTAGPAETRPVPRVAFGGEGTGEGRISHPKAIAVDANGTVYVADRTQRIQAFDGQGNLLRTLSVSTAREATGPLDQDITEVEGLAATRDGKLWVSIGYDLLRIDASTGRVEHTTRGQNGRTCFRDVSIDPRGELHARSACTNTDRYALVHLDARGRELHRYADPPDYDRAASGRVAVDGAGRWYVPYGTQSEVRILEADGRVFTRFGRRGTGPGEFESFALDALSLDAEGRVHVRDSEMLRIFAADGRFLRAFDPGSLGFMRTFAIGADGTIWVLTADGRIGAFDPPQL